MAFERMQNLDFAVSVGTPCTDIADRLIKMATLSGFNLAGDCRAIGQEVVVKVYRIDYPKFHGRFKQI